MQRRVGAVVMARLIKVRYVFIYLFHIGKGYYCSMFYYNCKAAEPFAALL